MPHNYLLVWGKLDSMNFYFTTLRNNPLLIYKAVFLYVMETVFNTDISLCINHVHKFFFPSNRLLIKRAENQISRTISYPDKISVSAIQTSQVGLLLLSGLTTNSEELEAGGCYHPTTTHNAFLIIFSTNNVILYSPSHGSYE